MAVSFHVRGYGVAAMAKRPKPVHQMTEREFETRFPFGDDDACKAYLKARRWPQGVVCPRCGNPGVYDLHTRKWHWQCTQCAPGGYTGYRFSVIAGTIFENTNKPLRDWFKVVHLMTTSKKGISALQIQRQLGFGSYGTAHSMCHKIRAAMIEPQQKLGGIVEVDETYVGGKDQIAIGIKRVGDVVVLLLARRQSLAQFNARAMSSLAFLRASLRKLLPVLCVKSFLTESACSRPTLGAATINWTENIRAVLSITTKANMLLAPSTPIRLRVFGSIFKRGVVGTFHKVSEKYMPLYVAEFQFRYNNRMNPDIFGATIGGCCPCGFIGLHLPL